MRTKLLSFLMLLTVAVNYGQITTSPAGIAIQGIARDNNNTAKTSATINMTFRIYYDSNIAIYEVSKVVTTDAFGVFSLVLEPGAANNVVIANKDASLQIKYTVNGTEVIISDEKLKQVPYAIAASNGVPTGSIMPYIGTTAPAGWVLCNGSKLSTDGSAAALITLVGDYAPNLQGMFLRGTGTSPVNSQSGPALKATQDDSFESHLHDRGTLVTETAGSHTHEWNYSQDVDNNGIGTAYNEFTLNPNGTHVPNVMKAAGDHTHTVSGSTGNSGGTETRPVNYGVNYIIKL